MSRDESNPQKSDESGPPLTSLAALAKAARERIGPEPDLVTPAATRTFAAIVRDLKGMPELQVTREHKYRLRLGRRGKVGALGLEYFPKIQAIELSYLNWPGAEPTSIKMHRYTYVPDKSDVEPAPLGEWDRMDDGGELIEDVHLALAKLYPEIGTP